MKTQKLLTTWEQDGDGGRDDDNSVATLDAIFK